MQQTARKAAEGTGTAEHEGWLIAHAAAKAVARLDTARRGTFALGAAGELLPVAGDDPRAVLGWHPARGWEAALAHDDPRRDVLELYLPISSAMPARPITIGHLGQSLDGFIATPSGDSCFVTGPQNILHLHRLRALCQAVIVGTETVAMDDPRLTTRLVEGSNPLRVILDREGRLPADHQVFSDKAAPTVRACAAGTDGAARARARGEDVLEIESEDGDLDLRALCAQLRARGCYRVFVEGGGVTVSSFLAAGLLDRLHIAVAPLLIGEGRPSIRLAPRLRLKDCLRLSHTVYRAGHDILFDCDLRAPAPAADAEASAPVQRIL